MTGGNGNHMFITIDTTHKLPIYRQITEEIKTLIVRGEVAPGTALPSVRQLATDLGVNLNTVAMAYRELQEAGLIKVRHGSGAVVISRSSPSQSVDELRRSLRVCLTGLVLAGLSRKEIQDLFDEELQQTIQNGEVSK